MVPEVPERSVRNPDRSGGYGGLLRRTGGALRKYRLVALTFLIWLGVAKGIEKMNKFMMPVFFILFLMLVRVIPLPGAMDGFRYMFVPKWEQLGNVKTWVYATDREKKACPRAYTQVFTLPSCSHLGTNI